MYWIHSPNDFAVFVYHFTCKTVFVPLGAKISEPYLPHQHFTRAQFAGPDLPGAQFAAPTFSRGQFAGARFARAQFTGAQFAKKFGPKKCESPCRDKIATFLT